MLLLILLLRRSQRRVRAANRETWSQWWVSRRETHGTFAYLVQELSCEDMENVRQFHRLDRHSCEEVVALVAPLIEKDTRLCCSVKPSERLSVKVDSHKLRYDAARHEAVRQDAAKTHCCCSHMQRLPLYVKHHSFESSELYSCCLRFTILLNMENTTCLLWIRNRLAILRLNRHANEGFT